MVVDRWSSDVVRESDCTVLWEVLLRDVRSEHCAGPNFAKLSPSRSWCCSRWRGGRHKEETKTRHLRINEILAHPKGTCWNQRRRSYLSSGGKTYSSSKMSADGREQMIHLSSLSSSRCHRPAAQGVATAAHVSATPGFFFSRYQMIWGKNRTLDRWQRSMITRQTYKQTLCAFGIDTFNFVCNVQNIP